jgi:hypothetical protein
VKLPVEIDGVELMYEVFTQFLPGVEPELRDRVICIEDRTYRVRAAQNGTYYTMFRIDGHQRSVRGSLDRLIRVVGLQHLIYKRYEQRVRKLKEEAQRVRDRQLNELAEAAG